MANPIEAEVKHVMARSKSGQKLRRDRTMTGGEKMETPREKARRRQRQRRPKEPPIIQKTPG